MKAAEIRELSADDLQAKLKEARAELFNLRFQMATSQLDNTARVKQVKKDIARIQTEMRARERNTRKVRQGVVVSAANDKTIVVSVAERKPHPVYKKMMTTTKKFHAHDENNEAGVGDTVTIMETRPLSKMKRWRLVEINEKAK